MIEHNETLVIVNGRSMCNSRYSITATDEPSLPRNRISSVAFARSPGGSIANASPDMKRIKLNGVVKQSESYFDIENVKQELGTFLNSDKSSLFVIKKWYEFDSDKKIYIGKTGSTSTNKENDPLNSLSLYATDGFNLLGNCDRNFTEDPFYYLRILRVQDYNVVVGEGKTLYYVRGVHLKPGRYKFIFWGGVDDGVNETIHVTIGHGESYTNVPGDVLFDDLTLNQGSLQKYVYTFEISEEDNYYFKLYGDGTSGEYVNFHDFKVLRWDGESADDNNDWVENEQVSRQVPSFVWGDFNYLNGDPFFLLNPAGNIFNWEILEGSWSQEPSFTVTGFSALKINPDPATNTFQIRSKTFSGLQNNDKIKLHFTAHAFNNDITLTAKIGHFDVFGSYHVDWQQNFKIYNSIYSEATFITTEEIEIFNDPEVREFFIEFEATTIDSSDSLILDRVMALPAASIGNIKLNLNFREIINFKRPIIGFWFFVRDADEIEQMTFYSGISHKEHEIKTDLQDGWNFILVNGKIQFENELQITDVNTLKIYRKTTGGYHFKMNEDLTLEDNINNFMKIGDFIIFEEQDAKEYIGAIENFTTNETGKQDFLKFSASFLNELGLAKRPQGYQNLIINNRTSDPEILRPNNSQFIIKLPEDGILIEPEFNIFMHVNPSMKYKLRVSDITRQHSITTDFSPQNIDSDIDSLFTISFKRGNRGVYFNGEPLDFSGTFWEISKSNRDIVITAIHQWTNVFSGTTTHDGVIENDWQPSLIAKKITMYNGIIDSMLAYLKLSDNVVYNSLKIPFYLYSNDNSSGDDMPGWEIARGFTTVTKTADWYYVFFNETWVNAGIYWIVFPTDDVILYGEIGGGTDNTRGFGTDLGGSTGWHRLDIDTELAAGAYCISNADTYIRIYWNYDKYIF